ncbi:nucleoside-diphosphate kinase [Micromonospora sp. FIMYZ51]|uniref:nucleoside-diphosphate kinase n=1 Tax=Micromonospora sp. FIMYZ51 TaxID=3051832 RepID=UPI00311F8CFB
MPRKAEAYRRETYFRDALVDATDLFGDAALDVVHDGALVMMKPDGLRSGKLGMVHDFVTDHGFEVVAVEEVTFTRHMWRELWRHQLNAATLDRLAIKDALYTDRDVLVLVLRCTACGALPGTVRLSRLKGSADLTVQAYDTLRSRLRQPNRVFSLVHFADEPADLLRELGVLFPDETRRRLLGALASGRLAGRDRARLDAALAHEATIEGDPFALPDAVARVEAALADTPLDSAEKRSRAASVAEHVRTATAGAGIDWRWLVAELSALGCPVDPWDVLVVGSYTVVADEPGEPKFIGNPDQFAWDGPVLSSVGAVPVLVPDLGREERQ